MQRVRVIHWKPAEAGPLIEQVQAGGFQAEYSEDIQGPSVLRAIRENVPDAVVIDLSKLPSHGREVAVWLRNNKSTRSIPLLFVDGEPGKVDQIRNILPDAVYTTHSRIRTDLKTACRRRAMDPIASPVVPKAMMERYREKSAGQKLGIVAGCTVGLMDAPRDYAAVLGDLPENVELREDPGTSQDVTVWFVYDFEGLLAAMRRGRVVAAKTKLWIAWRKGSGKAITQTSIRETARDAGLTDYKLCAIDSRWSAMLFARKKQAGERVGA